VFLLSFPPKQETAPGAVIAIQTFGDFLNFNPLCHVLCTDGGFYGSGSFRVAQALETEPLEKIFQHKVLGMLFRKGKITEEEDKLIMSWRHSGFNVHCGPRIRLGDEEAIEILARYIVRASFSQERMTYIPEESKVLYRSKDGKNEKTFDAIEWIAAMCSHVPNKGEQMVRYYGYYSNICRGQRKKANEDGWMPSILQPDEPSKGYRKTWARLRQKIYEIDPLTCPKCQGPMAVIAFIEAEDVIEKILKHLGLWELTPRPPTRSAKSLMLKHELDTLGFYLSIHPLDRYRHVLKGLHCVKACDLQLRVGEQVTTIGWLVTGKTVQTKDGDPMKFVSFEDTTGIYETVLFPKVYNRFCHMLNEMRPYLLKGKVEQDFTALTLTVHWIEFLDRPNQGDLSRKLEPVPDLIRVA
jgi:hypothetical protein